MIATYASYVWACYAVTAAVFIVLVWSARRAHRNELTSLRRRQQMQAGEKQ